MFDEAQLHAWFGWMRQIFSEQRDALNQLDSATGDGDHGYTVLRAFTAAEQAVLGPLDDLGQGFDLAAQALAETSGGAIGPILAALFADGGPLLKGKSSASTRDLAAFFAGGMAAVEQIGAAKPGDKTLVDALAPAAAALQAQADLPLGQALKAAAQAAWQGVESTKTMQAAHGRARFLGERSIGFQDAGATSLAFILDALVKAVEGQLPPPALAPDEKAFNPAPGKFTNHPERMVWEDNEGLALAFPRKVICTPDHILVRAQPKAPGKVGLAIGHGGGHTPSMGGLVGPGLLDADVYGPIFTCASGVRIARAIELAERGAGVLLLVSNHSGDVLNARLAVRRAGQAGIPVRMVLSSDDAATAPRAEYLERRGLGGLLFQLKVAGAAAEAGLNLEETVRLAEKANRHTATLAVAVRAPTHPASGQLLFDLPRGEVEIGTGVHGEVGVYRGPHLSADAVIDLLVERLLADLAPLQTGRVAAFINGSGGTSKMELHILYRRLCQALTERGLNLQAGIVDSLFTTQEMGGFSLSLLALDDELWTWFNQPAEGPYFRYVPTM